MNIRRICASANIMTRVGLVCLVVAILTNPAQNVLGIRSVISRHIANGNAYDAINGLLYGIAIGCLLRAIWLKRHPQSSGNRGAC